MIVMQQLIPVLSTRQMLTSVAKCKTKYQLKLNTDNIASLKHNTIFIYNETDEGNKGKNVDNVIRKINSETKSYTERRASFEKINKAKIFNSVSFK